MQRVWKEFDGCNGDYEGMAARKRHSSKFVGKIQANQLGQ